MLAALTRAAAFATTFTRLLISSCPQPPWTSRPLRRRPATAEGTPGGVQERTAGESLRRISWPALPVSPRRLLAPRKQNLGRCLRHTCGSIVDAREGYRITVLLDFGAGGANYASRDFVEAVKHDKYCEASIVSARGCSALVRRTPGRQHCRTDAHHPHLHSPRGLPTCESRLTRRVRVVEGVMAGGTTAESKAVTSALQTARRSPARDEQHLTKISNHPHHTGKAKLRHAREEQEQPPNATADQPTHCGLPECVGRCSDTGLKQLFNPPNVEPTPWKQTTHTRKGYKM